MFIRSACQFSSKPSRVRLGPLLGIAALLAACAQLPAHAANFSASYPWDARANAMSGAFTAIAVGPHAAFWNPGALGCEQPPSVSPLSRIRFGEGDDAATFVAFGVTHTWHRLGFGLGFSDISGGKFPYGDRDRTYLLGVGLDLLSRTEEKTPRVRLGLGGTLKRVEQKQGHCVGFDCDCDIPSAMDFDLGLLADVRLLGPPTAGARRPPGKGGLSIRLAAKLSNLRQADMKCSDSGGFFPLHRGRHVGAALQARTAGPWPLHPFLRVIAAWEHEWIEIEASPFIPGSSDYTDSNNRLGAEVVLLGIFAGRIGRTDGMRMNANEWSSGAGLILDLWRAPRSPRRIGLRFDYAAIPESFGSGQYHHWSLTFWGLR